MLVEGCKHEIEITVPVDEVERQTELVISEIQKKAKIPGFRPGKVPAGIIRTRFADRVRQDVLEKVIPDYLQKRIDSEDLKVVSRPNVSEVHFHQGEPLRFKADFEVAPQIELGEYRGVTIHYSEPEVSDADIDERLAALQEQKAQYITIDPRPAEDGDYCMVSLDSISGVDQPVHQDEMMLHAGDPDTLPAFTEALRGMSPDDEKEFEVTYPDEYAQEKLAGKTVKFRMKLKAIRRKELPELNDEFAKDLGDFNTLDELREAIRKNIFREREQGAQQKAKDELVGELVKAHDFPVPEAYVERQIESVLETQMRQWQARGIDISKIKIDWEKLKESQRAKAIKDVKASLLLDKISEREAVHATQDEVDREVQQIARQEREPVAAMRKKLEKNNAIGRIANHIRTEKTLNFLFENSRKVAGEPPAPEPEAEPESEPESES